MEDKEAVGLPIDGRMELYMWENSGEIIQFLE